MTRIGVEKERSNRELQIDYFNTFLPHYMDVSKSGIDRQLILLEYMYTMSNEDLKKKYKTLIDNARKKQIIWRQLDSLKVDLRSKESKIASLRKELNQNEKVVTNLKNDYDDSLNSLQKSIDSIKKAMVSKTVSLDIDEPFTDIGLIPGQEQILSVPNAHSIYLDQDFNLTIKRYDENSIIVSVDDLQAQIGYSVLPTHPNEEVKLAETPEYLYKIKFLRFDPIPILGDGGELITTEEGKFLFVDYKIVLSLSKENIKT